MAVELGVRAAAGRPGSRVGSSEQPARTLPRAGSGVRPDPNLHDEIDFQFRVGFIGSDFMVHQLHPAPASTTKSLIFAAFIGGLSCFPKIATTSVHKPNVIRQRFDDNIAGCPQQIMHSASAAPNEAIKSAIFA
jgi:hypothetical protein